MQGPPRTPDSPAEHYAAVTPSDSVDFARPARYLYVGVAGNLAAVRLDGTAVSFANLPVGWHPIVCRRVNSTGTTALSIVALF